MVQTRSFDSVDELGLVRPNLIYHDQGFITIPECPVTRSGIFLYKDDDYPDGIRRELRPHSEVFSENSLKSLAHLPLTILHPDVGVVTSTNFKGLDIAGSIHPDISLSAVETQEGLISDGIVRAKLTIYPQEVIEGFKTGEFSGFSMGYTCDRVFESGVFNGDNYDCYQKNIIYNHVAAVPIARYGIILDSNFGIDKKVYFTMSNKNTDDVKLDAANTVINELKEQNRQLQDKVKDLEKTQGITEDGVTERLSRSLEIYEHAKDNGLEVSLTDIVSDGDAVIRKIMEKVAPSKNYDGDHGLTYLNAIADLRSSQPEGKSKIVDAMENNSKRGNKSKPNRFADARENYLKN